MMSADSLDFSPIDWGNSSLIEWWKSSLIDWRKSLPIDWPNTSSIDCLTEFRLASDQTLTPLEHDCVCLHTNISKAEFGSFGCFPVTEYLVFETLSWIFYGLLVVLAAAGNALVCYVVVSSKKMQSVTNVYIANMAAGDLIMTCLCTPLTFVNVILLRFWPFGEVMCRVVSFSQALSVFVSSYTLVAISLDRHSAILHPLRPRGSLKRARVVILFIWLLAAITCIPIVVTSTIWIPDSPRYIVYQQYICQEVWQGDGRRYYNVVVLIMQYFLPVLVLAITYARVVREIWSQSGRMVDNTAREIRFSRAKRRTVIMMLTVVVVYTICWLPYHVLQILMDLNTELQQWYAIIYVFTACHWLSMSSCLWNPIIYCLMNPSFRSGFKQAFSSECCACSDDDNPDFDIAGRSGTRGSLPSKRNGRAMLPGPNTQGTISRANTVVIRTVVDPTDGSVRNLTVSTPRDNPSAGHVSPPRELVPLQNTTGDDSGLMHVEIADHREMNINTAVTSV